MGKKYAHKLSIFFLIFRGTGEEQPHMGITSSKIKLLKIKFWQRYGSHWSL